VQSRALQPLTVPERELGNRQKGVFMPGYTLVYWQDGEWLVGRLRERPDVFSQGRSLPELEDNIREALSLMAASDFQDLPPDY
jgi:predicted RNase H-like HicB family nuclease